MRRIRRLTRHTHKKNTGSSSLINHLSHTVLYLSRPKTRLDSLLLGPGLGFSANELGAAHVRSSYRLILYLSSGRRQTLHSFILHLATDDYSILRLFKLTLSGKVNQQQPPTKRIIYTIYFRHARVQPHLIN